MDQNDLFKVGIIISAHGVRGEVKVFPTTDDPLRFKKCKELLLGDQPVKVAGVKLFKQFVILKLDGLDDRDSAERLRKKELFVTRKDAVPLGKDEYFISDLIGLTVLDEEGTKMGILTDVLQTGANDVYEITFSDGYEYEGRIVEQETVLLPAIKQCILGVNTELSQIVVSLMPGLIE